MKNNFFVTPWTYVSPSGEMNSSPSLTQPDMSYTIPEILDKFAAGIPPPVDRSSSMAYDFTESNEEKLREKSAQLVDVVPKRTITDLTDIDAYTARLRELQLSIDSAKDAKAKADAEAAKQAIIDAYEADKAQSAASPTSTT